MVMAVCALAALTGGMPTAGELEQAGADQTAFEAWLTDCFRAKSPLRSEAVCQKSLLRSEAVCHTLKRLTDFHLTAKARIWP